MTTRKILLVNPTKHLGNLLVSLGLVQYACKQWRELGVQVLLVFDKTYENIIGPALPAENIVYYPRKVIENAGLFTRLAAYLRCARILRHFHADVALDMEADSISFQLTVLSGAKRRYGPYGTRHARWYHRLSEKRRQLHEYYKYEALLAMLMDVSSLAPGYGDVSAVPASPGVDAFVRQSFPQPVPRLVAIHAGATKLKKMWPVAHFRKLVELLQAKGFSPLLIGAGAIDREANLRINRELAQPVPDTCNQWNLPELVDLLKRCQFYVGNDSGPMHLASALGIPAAAIFGSSSEQHWGPLAATTVVVRGEACEPDCRGGRDCQVNYRCLASIAPERVCDEVIRRAR